MCHAVSLEPTACLGGCDTMRHCGQWNENDVT